MIAAAATDTGMLRERNEDRYWVDSTGGVFLVVDGVGGHRAGETAAQTAVESIRASLSAIPGHVEARVRRAIAIANNRIFELAQERSDLRGMACVLTLAVVENGQITIGHVGDSRLYLIWNGAMKKLTSDHSPVGEVEDAGEYTEAEAMCHPRRNEVFRDVGSRRRDGGEEDFIEIRRCRFRPDAALLLCSDGLTDHLTAAQVREIVDSYSGDAAQVAGDLVAAANRAGGKDNITALFVAGPEFCGRRHGEATGVRTRASETRARRPRSLASLLTGRVAFLAYGLLLGMIVWVIVRAKG
jgi:serine/threonine protein phosphatase PrpC